jgi:DNA repair protein RecO (recombination protein O)
VNAPSTLPRDKPHLREAEPAYLLHSYPFKETSLVVEAFSRNFGRVGLVAKGARRPGSALRGVLMAFQPLLLYWSGRSELHLLQRAEWQSGRPQMAGIALICGFYLNELVLKLTRRDDPHVEIYDAYEDALAGLRTERSHGAVLRRFERRMLAGLGYGLALTRDAGDQPIDAAASYVYLPESGAQRPSAVREPGDGPPLVSGKTLLDMARDDYSDPVTAQESKAVMRSVINHHLGGQVLHTRQLLREMQFL